MLMATNYSLLHMEFVFKLQMKTMLYCLKQKVSFSSHNPTSIQNLESDLQLASLEFFVSTDIVWPLLVVCQLVWLRPFKPTGHSTMKCSDSCRAIVLKLTDVVPRRVKSSGMWRRVIGRVVPDVSEDCSALIFRTDQPKNGLLIVSENTCILCKLCFVLA
jgi:hypothetical protein